MHVWWLNCIGKRDDQESEESYELKVVTYLQDGDPKVVAVSTS